MRSTCLSASRDARTHVRAHTSNLTGRFTRQNLKCKTETRVDADSASRLPRGIFCGPRALCCRRWYRCGALTLFDFVEAVAIDEKLIDTACKKSARVSRCSLINLLIYICLSYLLFLTYFTYMFKYIIHFCVLLLFLFTVINI